MLSNTPRADSFGSWVSQKRAGFRHPEGAAVRATHLKVKSVPMSSIDSSSALDFGKESR